MAEMMKIPILGVVENMAYFQCPSCKQQHNLFGESHIEDVAGSHGLEVLARLPIDPQLAQACDMGKIEAYQATGLDKAVQILKAMEGK